MLEASLISVHGVILSQKIGVTSTGRILAVSIREIYLIGKDCAPSATVSLMQIKD